MKIILLISFILLVFGILLCLGLTPSVITEDILSFITPKYSLRDRARISQGKKKTNRIASKILRIRDVMEATGQTKKFTAACALTVFLSCGGCILSLVLGNAWIIPVVIAAGLIVPFIYASNAIEVYAEGRMNSHLRSMDISMSMLATLFAANLINMTDEEIAVLRKDAVSFVDDNFRAKSFVKAIHQERYARERTAHS